jgi:diketogulonate reductase-like aldo/keto reductase
MIGNSTPVDWAAWRAMEAIHDSGRVRFLGVSNLTLCTVSRQMAHRLG